jgi:hypothetical protein
MIAYCTLLQVRMRRAPMFVWLPVVLSVGTISWALLGAGLMLLAALVLTPAMIEVKTAEATRNDYQATLSLLDQQIALQKDFTDAAQKDPLLMERLASRQLNLNRPDQEILILDPASASRDRSVRALLAESLQPVTPKPVTPVNPVLALATNAALRPMLLALACGAIALSFFLGIKYERA